VTRKKLCRGLALALLTGVITFVSFAPAAFGQDDGRKVRTKIDPVYPELAKRMNVAGTVKLMITISPSGSVKATKVIGGHPLLIDAAVQAVNRWKFEPANEETKQIIEFRFNNNQ